MRRFFRIAAAALCTLTLTGCSFGASVDSLLTPPERSEEQQEIYLALQDAVGTDITLQYPRSGDNLSAFIVTELDEDGETEALVFYETSELSTSENSLRIGILDQVGGAWQAVYDLPADGAEVESVSVETMGEEEKTIILIGYSSVDQSYQSLAAYEFGSGSMTSIFETEYTLFSLDDYDEDEETELLVLNRYTDTEDPTCVLYRLEGDDALTVSGKVELRASFSDYSQVLLSQRGEDTPAIFIDGETGSSTLQTEILYVDEDGVLTLALDSSEEVEATERQVGYLSTDIDGDGVVEIPVLTNFPGYDEDASEQVKMTQWYVLDDTALEEECRGYYSVSDSCFFKLPLAWYDKVTAYTDALTGDIVFCTYDESTDETGTELMRYCTLQDEEEIEEREEEGYMLLHTRGKAYSFMYAADDGEDLQMSQNELSLWFRFLESA